MTEGGKKNEDVSKCDGTRGEEITRKDPLQEKQVQKVYPKAGWWRPVGGRGRKRDFGGDPVADPRKNKARGGGEKTYVGGEQRCGVKLI